MDISDLDAIIFVKTLGEGFHRLHNCSVPLIWDHVDEWNGTFTVRTSTCMPVACARRDLHGADIAAEVSRCMAMLMRGCDYLPACT